MKATHFLYLICCISCLSCSNDQQRYLDENDLGFKAYEKVNSSELKHELISFLNQPITTRNYSTVNSSYYNFDNQEILRPLVQTSNVEMVVIRNKTNDNNIMAFYKENGIIENCLVIELIQNTTNLTEEMTFICRDIDNTPILKAEVNSKDNTCNVLEIYEGLNNVRSSGRNWGCNVSLGLAGAVWSTAFGMVTVGAGFAVSIGWCMMQTWMCSSASNVEFAKVENESNSNISSEISTHTYEELKLTAK